jgi:signal transduction histidine kinase
MPPIMADAHHLMQVFLNLVLNAVQAGSTQLRIECKALGQEQVQIDFSDNGCGIAEENLDKLFTPFFTTKEKGNGLGLSIIYKIIEEHHGHIMVTSKVGQGSTFSVLLPQAKSMAVPDNIIQMPINNATAQVAQGS